MVTKKEIQLATLLLKERLERLTGKKVILKEGVQRVTIEQLNDILTKVPPQEKIVLYMITKLRMNKFGKDEEGNKIPNPYFDKVIKKSIASGRINYSYGEEYEKNVGEKHIPTPGRDLGEKQGAIFVKDGKERIALTDVEYDTPQYEINGNPITKDELKAFLPPSNPQEGGVKMIAPYMSNVKTIAVGNSEYQVI